MERQYKLQDVYDYLMTFYNLEWRGYQIKDYDNKHNDYERGIRSLDFSDDKSYFHVIAIVYLGAKQKTVSLDVNNKELTIYEINPYLHHYKTPRVSWREFLYRLYGQEQGLNK